MAERTPKRPHRNLPRTLKRAKLDVRYYVERNGVSMYVARKLEAPISFRLTRAQIVRMLRDANG